MKVREKYIEKAKQSSFLDAVFLIVYYNLYLNLRGKKNPVIEPQAVFGRYSEHEYKIALDKAKRLLNQSGAMGKSCYKVPGAEPYQEAFTRMKTEHTGFSEENYKLVVDKGLYELK